MTGGSAGIDLVRRPGLIRQPQASSVEAVTDASSDTLAPGSARAWLEALGPRGIQLGLERVHAALARLGDPHKALRCVTVGGTNGKGSTAAFIDAMARAAGLRTTLYTSPHLVSVHERFVIDGAPVSDAALEAALVRVRAAVLTPPALDLTHFEALTVAAFDLFAAARPDLAVLEIGLGGRLDAVNAAEPLVSVLTSIARDHEAILGPTLSHIAREKVAIARPDRALVCAPSPHLWRRVIGPHARSLRAIPRRLGVDFTHEWLEDEPDVFRYRGWQHRVGPVRLSLRGAHQRENAALACAAIEALIDATGLPIRAHHMAEGLSRAVHRGRMERLSPADPTWPELLLDGAHNEAGARALSSQLDSALPPGPRVLLFGVNPEKRPRAMLRHLAPGAAAIVLTSPSARPGGDLDRLARRLSRELRVPVLVEPRPIAALDAARRLTVDLGTRRGRPREGQPSLVIAGSLYLLGDLIPWLPAPRRG
jgi:dihydrofolate synthase/folylpolyglutamate synthase